MSFAMQTTLAFTVFRAIFRAPELAAMKIIRSLLAAAFAFLAPSLPAATIA